MSTTRGRPGNGLVTPLQRSALPDVDNFTSPLGFSVRWLPGDAPVEVWRGNISSRFLSSGVSFEESPANGLLRARRVITLAPGSEGDAIWWHAGRVRAVGRAGDLERRVPSRVPRFELPNSVVTPGFVDGHTHFLQWALGRSRVKLGGAATRDEAVRRVAEGVLEQGWIIGQGWDANGWTEAPERRALDAVQSEPVYLDSLDVHAAWLNTAALAKAGIGRETPDPYGGVIVRDPSGEPTGLLLERAVELVTPHLPIPPADRLLPSVLASPEEADRT